MFNLWLILGLFRQEIETTRNGLKQYTTLERTNLFSPFVTSCIISLSVSWLMPLHISQTDNLYCLKFSSKRKGRKESVNKSNCENVTTELHHFFKVLYLVNTNKIIFFLLLAITSQHFKARHCLCFVIYNSNIYTPYTVFKVDHFNKICLFNAFLTACNFLAARTCYWKMAILMILKGRLIFPRRLFHYLRKILVCFLFYMYMYLIIVQ